MKLSIFLALSIIISLSLSAQQSYYGMTSKGGASNQGVIFKTDAAGSNLQTVFDFKYYHSGRTPQNVFTQASNGKIYGTTKYGGANICSFPNSGGQRHSGVIFEYNLTTDNYTVLFNFDDTASGCWPETAPVMAANGKLYGVTRGGGSTSNRGAVYSYDISSGTFSKLHAFSGISNDGEYPVGNLLLAADGKLYGITSSGGYNDKGIIFKIDPTTDTYTKLLDLKTGSGANTAAQGAASGLIQAPNGIMYGTSSRGGNYPPSYSYAYGNIFKYNPTTNVATNLYGFSNSGLGHEPEGEPVLVGTNSIYCITHKDYQVPGTYTYKPHYYLWKYTISSGTAMVVDSIANGRFNHEILVNTNGKIIITGHDYDISYAVRFWEFNPSTNSRTLLDTNANLRYFYKGLMQASNGKYYAGGAYPDANLPQYTSGDGSFVEYDASSHTVTQKFKFSEPVDGLNPEGDLIMATNGKLYGMTTKGGANNKGVVFEFNPANDSYTKKFDLDSLTGYEPKGGLMEASNGKLYGLTYRGGNNSYGTVFEIDTNSWTLTKKADFTSAIRQPKGRMVEAWDGKLYGLTSWNSGTIFQYDISTAIISNKHSFVTNDGTSPQGSLSLADNGKLYGLTNYGGQSYYSHGTLFEFDPATDVFLMKKELYNYTGYHAQGNTPTLGTDGKMYVIITTGGSGNTEYVGGAINEYIPGATSLTNKASFSVNNTGSKPMGDLMESANGNFYGYTWIGGANNKGTLFEYNPSTGTITKKVDFDGTNGGLPEHGSLTESHNSVITISQQPTISSVCVGDTAYLSIAANHATLLHYQWYKGGNRIAGATNDTLVFNVIANSDAGTYYCKITGGTKAVVSSNIIITPVNIPTVNISNLASAYCLNSSDVNLLATPTGGTYSGSGISASVFSASSAGVGSFDVLYTYTAAQGCSNADTVAVTVNALPVASFSGYASSYCNNNEIDTLIPTQSGGAFSGSTAITGNIFDPTTFPNGNWLFMSAKLKYTITDANNCTNSDSVNVSIFPKPTVDIGGLGLAYCHNADNDTAIVSPAGGSFTGNILANNIYSPANVGVDTLIYSFTNSNQCTNMDTAIITVNALPVVSIDNFASSYCDNEADVQVQLTPLGGTLSAISGLTGSTFSPSSANVGANTITYSFTDANNCSNSESINFDVFEAPQVDLGSDKTICINHELTLDAGAGTAYNYLWNDGSSQQTLILDVVAIGVGTHVFSVDVQNTNCADADTVNVIIEACTSVNDIDNMLAVSVFPNPSKGKFFVSFENIIFNTIDIKVYSTTGKCILNKNINTSSKESLIDLSEMPKGIYYLEINTNLGIIKKKLIVQ